MSHSVYRPPVSALLCPVPCPRGEGRWALHPVCPLSSLLNKLIKREHPFFPPTFHSKRADVGCLGQGSWVGSDPRARQLSRMEGEPFLGIVSVLFLSSSNEVVRSDLKKLPALPTQALKEHPSLAYW